MFMYAIVSQDEYVKRLEGAKQQFAKEEFSFKNKVVKKIIEEEVK